MSAGKITFTNKQPGDLFTNTDCNMIKQIVNSHADDIDSLNGMAETVNNQTTVINDMTNKEQVVQKTGGVHNDIKPGPLYVWSSAVTALVLGKVAGTAGKQNEYKLQFTVSGTEFSLTGTLMTDVRWLDEPDWEDGFTYQVSILNGLAIAAGWEAAGA